MPASTNTHRRRTWRRVNRSPLNNDDMNRSTSHSRPVTPQTRRVRQRTGSRSRSRSRSRPMSQGGKRKRKKSRKH